MKAILLLGVIAFGAQAPHAPPKQYLCVADQAVGFKFEENRWQDAVFRTDNKYVLAPSDGVVRPKSFYLVRPLGKSSALPDFVCGPDQIHGNGASFDCRGVGGHFLFSSRNGRYIIASVNMSYVDVGSPSAGGGKITDESADSPYLEIGRCSLL